MDRAALTLTVLEVVMAYAANPVEAVGEDTPLGPEGLATPRSLVDHLLAADGGG
jgi:hypothetical protein